MDSLRNSGEWSIVMAVGVSPAVVYPPAEVDAPTGTVPGRCETPAGLVDASRGSRLVLDLAKLDVIAVPVDPVAGDRAQHAGRDLVLAARDDDAANASPREQ